MHRARIIVMLVVVLAAGLPFSAVSAIPPSQAGELTLFAEKPLVASLDAATLENTHPFDCTADSVLSISVEPVGDDPGLALVVFDAGAKSLVDGLALEGGRVVAEAFTPPTDGTCSVTVSGSSAGEYRIQLLAGFADLSLRDTFSGEPTALGMTWPPYEGTAVNVGLDSGQMWIEVFSDNQIGYALPEEQAVRNDFYAQVDITVEGTPSYYEYGFQLHSDSSGDTFYTATFSSDSDWSVYYFDGEWTELQPWTVSPVIDGSDQEPQIGVLVQNQQLSFYFNNALVGSVDMGDYATEGEIGLVAGTIPDQTDILKVRFDNLTVTTPAGPTDSTAAPVPDSPTGQLSLTNWESGAPQEIVAEMREAGLVPSGGSIGLTVPNTYGDTSNDGFNFYSLGGGKQYSDFVLGFEASLGTTGPGSGCGMYFRSTGSTSSDALIFENGYFYLAYFGTDGDADDASVYDTHPAINTGEGASNHVVIMALDEQVILWINGQQVAETAFPAETGEVALEMYVNSDDNGATQRTYCELNDVWLWEF
jgi:hypothetical protein